MRESADFDQLTVPGSYTRCGLKLELGDSWDPPVPDILCFFLFFIVWTGFGLVCHTVYC